MTTGKMKLVIINGPSREGLFDAMKYYHSYNVDPIIRLTFETHIDDEDGQLLRVVEDSKVIVNAFVQGLMIWSEGSYSTYIFIPEVRDYPQLHWLPAGKRHFWFHYDTHTRKGFMVTDLF